MKKTTFLILILCLLVPTETLAQADVMKSISQIKRDNSYLYAEATMKDLTEAINGAKAILEITVGDWVRTTSKDEGIELCIAKAKEHCLQIQTRRGEYYRAFVYVRKSDIMPVTDKSEIVVFQIPQSSAAVESVRTDDGVEETVVPAKPITLSADEQAMARITSFYDIEPFINRLKGENRIERYGKYATMPQTALCHLFVYDKQGRVVAALRNDNGRQTNLATLREDDVKNYKNCGAIWFQLKQ